MVLSTWTRAFNLVFMPLLFVLLAGVREVEYRTGRISGSVSGVGGTDTEEAPSWLGACG